jgi:hypothetical protein
VLEAAQPIVTVVAQQAPDFPGVVAMVNAQASCELGVVMPADRASLSLPNEESVVFRDRDAIGALDMGSTLYRWSIWGVVRFVIASLDLLGIGQTPLFLVIRLTPFAPRPALYTPLSVIMAKLIERFRFSAACASFHGSLGTMATAL